MKLHLILPVLYKNKIRHGNSTKEETEQPRTMY